MDKPPKPQKSSTLKTLASKDVEQTTHVVFGTFDLAASLVQFGLLLSVFSSVVLYIAAVGLVLVGVRTLFFLLIPTLITLADPIVLGINGAIVALDAFSGVVSGFILALSFGSDYVDPLDIDTISIAEYKQFLRDVASECSDYRSIGVIWERMLTPDISRSVCPYARAVYPELGNALHGLEGVVTSNPDPYGNNCDISYPPHIASVCVGLGSGYIIIEFFLPLLIACIFLYTSGRSLLRLLWVGSELVLYLAYTGIDAVVVAGDGIERAVIAPVIE